MNYFRPLKRAGDERWDFTVTNDGITHPVGYCAGWQEPAKTEQNAHIYPYLVDHAKKMQEHKHKFHTDGHETFEEAVECYRQYQLDTTLRLDGEDPESQQKCEECGTWTQGRAIVAHQSMVLCDEHRTREVVERKFVGSSEIASS